MARIRARRPADCPPWVSEIGDQCVSAGVPFFFKQWGGTRKKKTSRELKGRTLHEMPTLASAAAL
jgi:protein gp37